jgi:hypothetical protein
MVAFGCFAQARLICPTNRRVGFDKRGLLFVGVHNETLPVVAICVSDKDRSAFTINGCDTSPMTNRLC